MLSFKKKLRESWDTMAKQLEKRQLAKLLIDKYIVGLLLEFLKNI